MINLLLGNKKLLLLAFFLVLIFAAMLTLVFSPRQTTPPKTVPKSSLSIQPFVQRNIVINQTQEKEIDRFSNLKNKESSSSGQTKYFLSSERVLRDDLIITRNTKAIFERKVTDSRDPNQPILEEIIKQYGQPETTKTGSYHYGDQEQTLVFAKFGFAILLNPYTNYIDEVHRFTPTSDQEYLSTWGEDIYKEPILPSE